MIIDIHTHQCVLDKRTQRMIAGGQKDQPPVEMSDRMLELAGEVGIERVCLLSRLWAHPPIDGIREINDNTIAMVRRHPGRIYGLCFMNPRLDPAFVREEIDRCMHAGLSGVKLEIEVPANDPMLDPIMEKVVEHDAFLLHHAWYKLVNKCPQESEPWQIAHLARRHPEATVVMPHLAGCGVRGVLDVLDCPNVLVDTSGTQCVAGMIEYAVATLGAERVLFGSDAILARDFAPQIAQVYGAALSESQRKMILGTNAARLLKINAEVN